MGGWLVFLLFWVGVCLVMYLLYRQGMVASKCIAAVLFVFYPGKNADRLTLNSCTGWLRHMGRFQAGRTYEFRFSAQMSEGTAEVLLLDREKRPLLKMDRQTPVQRAERLEKGRYYLYWSFQKASGTCALHWTQVDNTPG